METVKNFFIKPSAIFEKYKEKPTWGLKLLVVTLITGLYGLASKILTTDLYPAMLEKQLKDAPNKEEAMNQALAMYNSPIANVFTFVGGALAFLGLFFIICFVIWLLVKAVGGKARYLQVVAVYSLASMAGSIGLVLKAAFMFATKNLAFLNMEPTVSSVLFESVDLFYIWSLVLLVIGFKASLDLPEKKGIIIVSILWLLTLAISFGFYFLSTIRMA